MKMDVSAELAIESLNNQISELKKEITEQKKEINELYDMLEDQKRETIKYMAWYETINNSTIWKLTGPIRKIMAWRNK